MVDPLQQLFGRKLTKRPLLGTTTPRVHHGALSRLPAFFRDKPLDSVAALCAAWSGRIQVANGTESRGLQSASDLTPAKALGLGLTVYFPSLHGLVDAGDWLAALERAGGMPAGSIAMMGFSNAPGTGLPVHHDAYDQILIQLVGTKRFAVRPNGYVDHPAMQSRPEEVSPAAFGPTYQAGFPPDSAAVLDDVTELVLEPGSALYLPGGTWHTTTGQPGTTLTVVLQLRVPSRIDVVGHYLALWLTQDDHWRTRPYGLWAGDDRDARAQLQQDLHALADRIGALDPSELGPAWQVSQALSAGSPFPDHPWERWIRLPEFAVDVHEDAVANRLRVVGTLGQLITPDRTVELTLPATARPALDWILGSTRAFTRTELAAQFPDAPLDPVLTELCAQGLIRPIPVPPLA